MPSRHQAKTAVSTLYRRKSGSNRVFTGEPVALILGEGPVADRQRVLEGAERLGPVELLVIALGLPVVQVEHRRQLIEHLLDVPAPVRGLAPRGPVEVDVGHHPRRLSLARQAVARLPAEVAEQDVDLEVLVERLAFEERGLEGVAQGADGIGEHVVEHAATTLATRRPHPGGRIPVEVPPEAPSRAYRKMLKNLRQEGRQNDAQQFISEKMRSALWMIKSLDQRQRTIYKVATSIVRQQRDFLDHGIDFLRPMVLRDVAEDIGMHESTVSRVTTSKYVHTPQGIFELKFFFNSGISRTDGDEVASEAVKTKIKQIIAAEDPRHPYSDQKIVELLKDQTIDIARRTVAKYREGLGIPSSVQRRREARVQRGQGR